MKIMWENVERAHLEYLTVLWRSDSDKTLYSNHSLSICHFCCRSYMTRGIGSIRKTTCENHPKSWQTNTKRKSQKTSHRFHSKSSTRRMAKQRSPEKASVVMVRISQGLWKSGSLIKRTLRNLRKLGKMGTVALRVWTWRSYLQAHGSINIHRPKGLQRTCKGWWCHCTRGALASSSGLLQRIVPNLPLADPSPILRNSPLFGPGCCFSLSCTPLAATPILWRSAYAQQEGIQRFVGLCTCCRIAEKRNAS